MNSYALGSDKQYSGFGYYENWPEAQFSYGSTEIGKMDFTGQAYGMVDNTLSIDKKTVSKSSAGFIPHIKVPMDGALIADSQSVLTLSPRLKYEKLDHQLFHVILVAVFMLVIQKILRWPGRA